MPEPSLNQLEREVEGARAKLASDLSRLRSPDTAAEFTQGLKQEAIEAKDALLDKAKASVQSTIESLIEDVKARAAANPAAALAIGAGVAWRLIRHPPIATALVGAGLISLFRTTPVRMNGRTAADYLSHAKDRLLEQTMEAADVAKEKAVAFSETVSEQVAKTTADVADRVEDLSAQAESVAQEAAEDTKARASAMWSKTAEGLAQAGQSARSTIANGARDTIDQFWAPTQESMNDPAARDKLLLGAAGLAVVTALGIICQRRIAEHSPAD
jgi:F0F1-type ATP synthase membrane subunit b/b'